MLRHGVAPTSPTATVGTISGEAYEITITQHRMLVNTRGVVLGLCGWPVANKRCSIVSTQYECIIRLDEHRDDQHKHGKKDNGGAYRPS